MDASSPRYTFTLEYIEDDLGKRSVEPLKAGDLCPKCGQEQLDYDGMLNLTCAVCGYSEAGCFT